MTNDKQIIKIYGVFILDYNTINSIFGDIIIQEAGYCDSDGFSYYDVYNKYGTAFEIHAAQLTPGKKYFYAYIQMDEEFFSIVETEWIDKYFHAI